MTAQKPKRRHHHVWQQYLKPWTTNGAIWCIQDGKTFSTGTTTIAVGKDFYKLPHLSSDEIAFIKAFFSKGDPRAQKTHAHLLDNLMRPFQAAEQMGRHPDQKVLDQLLDHYGSSVLEDYHARIEASFIPSLESALNGDISFYNDDRCIPFINYLCTQYMRTRGIKERAIERCKADGSADLTRVWNVMIHMFATNIGADLYRERRQRKLALIRNYTDVPFITGDQPAVNVKATPPNPPEHLSIYYPLSPQLALILADVDEEPLFPSDGLTAAQASALNRMLFESCYKQVFAQSEASLRML